MLNTYVSEYGTTAEYSLRDPLLGAVEGRPLLASISQILNPCPFKARPALFVAGNRLTLGYRHFSGALFKTPFKFSSWLNLNLGTSEALSGADLRLHGSLNVTPSPLTPEISNLSGGALETRPSLEPLHIKDKTLDYLRHQTRNPSNQLLT